MVRFLGTFAVAALILHIASPAFADCKLEINELGDRIKQTSQQTSPREGTQSGPSVQALEQKLNETLGDLKTGARAHDITKNRMATANEPDAGATVSLQNEAKTGVVHSNQGTKVVEPESTDPLIRAEDYWRQARQLYARGAHEDCSKAVEAGNNELNKLKKHT